ncbi:MAG: hypothetical protein ABDH21_04220 [bacterium]
MKIFVIVMIIILVTVTSYAQTVVGNFVRFGSNSVVIKTENDILNLPISSDLIVLDNKGQRVSPASLYENAKVTAKYENGKVISIVVDSEHVNLSSTNQSKPEYQLLYRDTTYQYKSYQAPVKVSYFGYLPVDYQYIYNPPVNLSTGQLNYYSYVPVYNYTFGGSASMANEIDFYNNLIANNYYSPRYYYEMMSSLSSSEVPNYYYISKMQEKTPYYYKTQPTQNIPATQGNPVQALSVNTSTTNTIFGTLVDIRDDKLVVYADRIYQVEVNNLSNLFVRKSGKYIPINDKQELRNLLNKSVELTVTTTSDKIIANTVVISAQ